MKSRQNCKIENGEGEILTFVPGNFHFTDLVAEDSER